MPVRDTAPLSLTLTLKPLGRRQLDSVRVVATMSGSATPRLPRAPFYSGSFPQP